MLQQQNQLVVTTHSTGLVAAFFRSL